MPSFLNHLLDETDYGAPEMSVERAFVSEPNWPYACLVGHPSPHIFYELADMFASSSKRTYPEQIYEDWFQRAGKLRISDPLVASAHDLSEVLGEVNDLAFEEEEDQFGLIRPSYHGYKQCMRLLLQLAKEGKLLKPTDITTDHNGDIRIAWTKGSNEAELICPSEGSPYLYFSSGESYGTDTDITAEKIAERARWAMDGR